MTVLSSLSNSGLYTCNLLNSQRHIMHFDRSDWFMESQLSHAGNDSQSSDQILNRSGQFQL